MIFRTAQPFQIYQAGRLVSCRATRYWKPFYEVCLPDASCSEPILVPIPLADQVLHDAVKSAANNLLAPREVVVVAQLSGGDTSYVQCCTNCGIGGSCHGSHAAPRSCGCGKYEPIRKPAARLALLSRQWFWLGSEHFSRKPVDVANCSLPSHRPPILQVRIARPSMGPG